MRLLVLCGISKWKVWSYSNSGYAMRGTTAGGKKSRGYTAKDAAEKTRLMHRQILGLIHGDGKEVDHINKDRLDNRRANLRVVTRKENCANHYGSIKIGARGMHTAGITIPARSFGQLLAWKVDCKNPPNISPISQKRRGSCQEIFPVVWLQCLTPRPWKKPRKIRQPLPLATGPVYPANRDCTLEETRPQLPASGRSLVVRGSISAGDERKQLGASRPNARPDG